MREYLRWRPSINAFSSGAWAAAGVVECADAKAHRTIRRDANIRSVIEGGQGRRQAIDRVSIDSTMRSEVALIS
jgi:hypothetical protein